MSSSTPDENAHDHAQDKAAFLASMRDGVLSSMDRLRASLGRAAHPTLTAMICASACAPVIAAATGAGLTLTAALGLLGSLGGNAISEFVSDRLARLKARNAPDTEAALAEAFAEVLESDSPDLAETRKAVTALLERTGAFTIVIREAIVDGDRDLLNALRTELERLAQSSDESRHLLLEQKDLLLGLYRDFATSLNIQTSTRDTAEEALGVLVEMYQFVQYTAATPNAGDAPQTASWTGSPYLGLQPFTRRHAPVFFGRSVTLSKLVAKAEACVPGGMMIVTGPSGVGKSSLLRAGLARDVESGLLREDPAQAPWRTITLERPGEHPIAALAAELAKHGGPDSTATETSLRAHPEAAAARVEERRTGDDGQRPERLLILIDQAEELFTLADDEERSLFLRALESIAKSPNAFTVLGIRSDYIDHCMTVPSLRETAQHRLFRVGPMTRDQMRQAITLPAAAAGVRIDDRVVSILLDDLFGANDTPRSPGAALPLMSQTMLLLWNHGSADRRLTEAEYTAIGGVHRAVTTAADAVYNDLTEPERITAQHLFRRLVGAESADQLVRTEVAADSLTDAEQAVAGKFLEARLLVTDAATLQIAHDILLKQWERLRKWMEPDLTARILFTRLEAAASEREQRRGGLYDKDSLTAIETNGEPRWPELGLRPSALAAEFLRKSRLHAQRQERDRRIRFAAVAIVAVLAIIASLVFLDQNGELADQRDELADTLNRTVSQRLAAESIDLLGTDGELARLLAAAAWNLSQTNEAYEALIRSANDPTTGLVTTETLDPVGDLATSLDGAYAASTGSSGMVTLWRTEDWTELGTLATDGTYGYASTGLEFSRDGTLLASLTENGVTVWDVESREPVAHLATTARGEIALSPDASTFAIGGETAVEIWDMATESMTAELPIPEFATAIAFSHNGASLFTSDLEGEFREWNPVTGEGSEVEGAPTDSLDEIWVSSEEPGRLFACDGIQCYQLDPEGEWTALPFGGVYSEITFDVAPDGGAIVGYGEGALTRWDAETGVYSSIPSVTGEVNRMVLFAGSSAVAMATTQGIQTWDIDGRKTVEYLPQRVERIAVAADSDRIVLDALEGVSVFEPPSTSLGAVSDDVFFMDFADLSHDGSVVGGTGNADGTFGIYLWDAVTSEPLPVPSAGDGFFQRMRFSPTENQLAIMVDPDSETVTRDSEIWIWDFTENKITVRIAESDPGLALLAYTPDGKHVVVSDGSGTVRFLSSQDGSESDTIEPIETGDTNIGNLAFSQDGQLLAMDGLGGVRVWDFEAAEMQSTGAKSTADMMFTPDGKFVLITDNASTNVWNIERSQLVPDIFPGAITQYGEFQSGTWTLVGMSGERIVYPDMSFLSDPYKAACERTDRALSRDEWEKYLKGFDSNKVTICS
ncbi:AAA family ATPase [Glycomyces sp. MUSA5-2]|uniref:AAA family ATPase n=1 Tax=Glycomyces sp. MUSA5-2 TaxID=2053002 RepID=UPI00300827CC